MNKIIVCVFAVSLLSAQAFASCAQASTSCAEDETASTESPLAAVVASKNSESFKVSKMSCMRCASKIRKALKTDLNLQEVSVDIKTKTVTVNCPTSGCPREKITSTLAGIGYPVDATL